MLRLQSAARNSTEWFELDRNVDLPVMLHHTWTYQALVHDLLDLRLNKIQLEVQETDDHNHVKRESKTYDLDHHDAFWEANTSTPFQNIAVAVNAQLKEYKSALDEFNKMSGGGVDMEHYDESQILDKTKDLGSFVTTIPMLREKKRIIDVHTNIATALLAAIKARELDSYFSLEESLVTRAPLDRKELSALLSPDAKGNTEDKLRLFLMYYMATSDVSTPEFAQLEELLKKANIDLTALRYLKQCVPYQSISYSFFPFVSLHGTNDFSFF